jgi:hypothetical protein
MGLEYTPDGATAILILFGNRARNGAVEALPVFVRRRFALLLRANRLIRSPGGANPRPAWSPLPGTRAPRDSPPGVLPLEGRCSRLNAGAFPLFHFQFARSAGRLCLGLLMLGTNRPLRYQGARDRSRFMPTAPRRGLQPESAYRHGDTVVAHRQSARCMRGACTSGSHR